MSRLVPLVSSVILIFLLAGPPLQAQQTGWTVTGSLGTPRSGHTATLLADGRVLAVGGANNQGNAPDSAELYDPATGQWRATVGLNSLRGAQVAVRLNDGRVLVAGPIVAEIFDPVKGSWSDAGDCQCSSVGTATRLADGRVLIVGGSFFARLYDPAIRQWSWAGVMNGSRFGHTATLLRSGKVLVVGGSAAPGSAELFDPATGKWTVTGGPITPRLWDHQAALLPNGKVLVVGGGISGDDYCNGLDSAELYDPETGQWSPTSSPSTTRNDYYMANRATLLPNGTVLLAGGASPGCYGLKSAEIYDPATGSWRVTAGLNKARLGHTLTLLANGKVLAAGGGDFDGETYIQNGNTAELYDGGQPALTSIPAASLAAGGALAPESIAIAAGSNLAITTQIAPSSLPLPTQLGGAGVKIRDSAGAERLAALFFVSPGQITYQVPAGTAVGLATVMVTSGGNIIASGPVEIAGVAPGLFSADSTGSGVAAGFWIRVAAGGAQTQGYLYDLNTLHPAPLDLGPAGSQMFLSLYGTGFRRGTGAAVTVGGVIVPVNSFAPVTVYQGLDIVKIGPLPRTLEGRGEVGVAFSVDGKAANVVTVNIR